MSRSQESSLDEPSINEENQAFEETMTTAQGSSALENSGYGQGSSKKMRKKKLPKDPEAPKKPLSAYFLWAAATREQVRAELGNISVTMMAKELGSRWSSVDPNTKASYENMAASQKEQYALAKAQYTPKPEFLQKVNMAKEMKAKKLKDKDAPKRPSSAFFLWSGEERQRIKSELGSLSTTQMAKELGSRWSSVDPDTKARFQRLAETEKEKYATAKAQYTPNPEFLQMIKGAKAMKVTKLKDKDAPKRPASAFLLWSKEERARVKAELGPLSTTQMAKELGSRWSSVDADTKAKFEKLAASEKEKYMVAMQNYTSKQQATGQKSVRVKKASQKQ